MNLPLSVSLAHRTKKMSAITTHMIMPGSHPVSYIFNMVTGDSEAAVFKVQTRTVLFKLTLIHPLQFF